MNRNHHNDKLRCSASEQACSESQLPREESSLYYTLELQKSRQYYTLELQKSRQHESFKQSGEQIHFLFLGDTGT
jgi:hypothetical protein